jgi:hypothetical protein
VDFQTCRVISRTGRDVVAAEPIQGGLRIVFADTPDSADDYDIVVLLEGYQPRPSDAGTAAVRAATHSGASALLLAENTALRDLVGSQRAQLAADAKTIAGLRGAVASSPPPDAEPAKAGAQSIMGITGGGSKTTRTFTVVGDWDLNWSYDCRAALAPVGGKGNFQVYIYNADGTLSFENTLINQIGDTDSGVEHYHHGGTFYLVINTLGGWKIDVNEPR